jgi:hypothetical protein
MKILFLDDERNPAEVTWINYPTYSKIVVVRTWEEFQNAVLTNPPFDAFSLDHDLQDFDKFSGEEQTGYSSLLKIMQMCPNKRPATVVAHSKNIVGASNINKLWESLNGYSWN